MPPSDTARPLVHPNGLRLALPSGFAARIHGDGFVVEPDPPSDLRSPVRVHVALLAQPRPLTAERRTREVAPGQRYDYAVTRVDAVGSGGAEVTLDACRSAGGHWLCLWQTHLSKHAEPAFELWAIAAAADVP